MKLQEVVSSLLILTAVLIIGAQMRVGWLIGVAGSLLRLPIMCHHRRWYYVCLDITFIMLDLTMFGAWSGWWPNYPRIWILGLL